MTTSAGTFRVLRSPGYLAKKLQKKFRVETCQDLDAKQCDEPKNILSIIEMHIWLKQYCYKVFLRIARKILCYVVFSCLLHAGYFSLISPCRMVSNFSYKAEMFAFNRLLSILSSVH